MTKNYIACHNVAYHLPNGNLLFNNVNLDLAYGEKIALIGENGVGKSTLLKLIAGEAEPSCGSVCRHCTMAVVAQEVNPRQKNIKEVLKIADKLDALARISNGTAQPDDWDIVNDDWDLEQRLHQELDDWNLEHLDLDIDFSQLSGGEKEKLLIIGAFLQHADIILLDEPTNNLDQNGKEILLQKIIEASQGILIITHDRNLLKQMTCIWELSKQGVEKFGGNFAFYEQEKNKQKLLKEAELTTAMQEVASLNAQKQKQEQKSRSQKAYGEKQAENRRHTRVAAGAMKRAAENTAGKRKKETDEKFEQLQNDIYQLGLALKEDVIKIPLPDKPFIRDRLLELNDVCFSFNEHKLIDKLSLVMRGSERVAVRGANGCGKTTLLKLILGDLVPLNGSIKLNGRAVYLNQDLSLLNTKLSIVEAIREYNDKVSLNEAYKTLANFKFRNIDAEKTVKNLSGGEKLKACLAAIFCTTEQPDILILDEPTNNLDIKSIEILENALAQYQGALLVVSHDIEFITNIRISRFIDL